MFLAPQMLNEYYDNKIKNESCLQVSGVGCLLFVFFL